MKIYMQRIQMIVWFEDSVKVTPIQFQMLDNEKQKITIKIDNIILRQDEKLAGNRMIHYQCQSIINQNLMAYELKYEVSTCKLVSI